MISNWFISQINKFEQTEILNIAKENNISPFLAIILCAKNIKDQFEISNMFSNDLDLNNFKYLKDIIKAANRINFAIQNNEKICVYGDYDTDGICSTVLLFSYLRDHGANVSYYIPDRKTEGYGLNCSAIGYLKKQNVQLIITVDNGISSINEAEYIKTNGMELIVTDHHQQRKNVLPCALAIVNPHQHNCKSKFKLYAGVTVTFKLICALESLEDEDPDLELLLDNYADLVALGTIADLVPLIGENRNLVKYALKNMPMTNSVAIKAILDESQLTQSAISSQNLAFSVIPKLNVMGRLANVGTAVKLLLSEDYDTAYSTAQELSSVNNLRKELDSNIFCDIENILLEENNKILYDRVMVISGDNWNEGVIGIVASKIVAKYNKPCIIITKSDDSPDISKASGRSVVGFSIYDLIYECKDLLIKFGGHPMAVGFSLPCENVKLLKDKINEICAKKYSNIPIPKLNISCKLNVSALNLSLVNEIKKLAPFGLGNEEPVFAICSVNLLKIIPLANDKHLKLIVEKKGVQATLLYFFMSTENFPYQISDTLDFAVTLDTNCFRDYKSLSIIVRDVRLSELNWDVIYNDLRLFEVFERGEEKKLSPEEKIYLKPNRDDIAVVYKYLKKNADSVNTSIFHIFHKINKHIEINICKLLVSLEVLSELKLIRFKNDNYYYQIHVLTVQKKQNLASSKILERLS